MASPAVRRPSLGELPLQPEQIVRPHVVFGFVADKHAENTALSVVHLQYVFHHGPGGGGVAFLLIPENNTVVFAFHAPPNGEVGVWATLLLVQIEPCFQVVYVGNARFVTHPDLFTG